MAIQSPKASSPSLPLTLPPSQFAKLASRSYLHAHLNLPSSRRPSGRLPNESRKPSINTGSLTHCHGSAVVRCGDTAVVCGIRGEILNASDVVDFQPLTKPDDYKQRIQSSRSELSDASEAQNHQIIAADAEELAQFNLLVPNVELSTGCSPSYLPGGPPSTEAQSLSHRVLNLLHTSRMLSIDDLRIWYDPPPAKTTDTDQPMMSLDDPASGPVTRTLETTEDTKQPEVKAFWTLYISILVLSLSGPPLPTIWGALIAALRNTRLPKAWWDADRQSVVCSPSKSNATSFLIKDPPIAASFGIFNITNDGAGLVTRHGENGRKTWILADVDGFEAALCEEEVMAVIGQTSRGRTNLIKIEKFGGGVLGREEMRECVDMATERRRVWIEALDTAEPEL